MPTALVTGGSSGIGLAVARALRRRGDLRLVLAARSTAPLQAAADELGARAVTCDVTQPADVARLAAVLADEGGCDVLVQCAGIAGHLDVLSAPLDTYRRVLATNYLGLVAVGHALWPQLVARRGRAANVVSVAGTVALARSGPYSASKHAALAWSRGLAAAGRRHGVHVTTVDPGPVPTPGFPQRQLLLRPLTRHVAIDADRCAALLVAALGRGAAEVFVPQWWRAAAAVQGLAPGLTARASARLWRRAPGPVDAVQEAPAGPTPARSQGLG